MVTDIIQKRMVSCSQSDEGIKYSTDYGHSWKFSNVKNGSFSEPVYTKNGDILVRGIGCGADGVWLSEDGGRTWTQVYTTENHYHFGKIVELNEKMTIGRPQGFNKLDVSEGESATEKFNTGKLYVKDGSSGTDDDYILLSAETVASYLLIEDDGVYSYFGNYEYYEYLDQDESVFGVEYIASGIESDAGTIKSYDSGKTWEKIDSIGARFNISKFNDYPDENICEGLSNTKSNSNQGRNLKALFKASTIEELAQILKLKSTNRDYSGLQLGDYFDLPTLTFDSTTYANSDNSQSDDYQKLRMEICGFGTYDGNYNESNPGILFQCKNIPFTHRIHSSTSITRFDSSELKTLFATAATDIESTIGQNLQTVKRYIDDAWFSEKLFLPSEPEVFGEAYYSKTVYQNAGFDGTNNTGADYNTSIQWPIFARCPNKRIKRYQGTRNYWWECSYMPAYSGFFCDVYDSGFADCSNADNAGGGVPFAFYL